MFVHNGIALIETVDVISPVVDDPFTFGAISATNALSDVYAMGGRPLTALAIAGYPPCSCEPAILREILRGASHALQRAKAVLVGGHSFDDDEIKFGLAVTGTGSPNHILRATGALPGHLLVLTKPLGIGIITTALKGGRADEKAVQEAIRWMLTSNDVPSACALQGAASACTDVTGFGLLGHAYTMVRNTSVSFEIRAQAVPVLDAAWKLMDKGLVPEGAYKNRAYLKNRLRFSADLSEEMELMLCDPQTSGGLLLSLPEDSLRFLHNAGVFHTAIGRVLAGSGDIRIIR